MADVGLSKINALYRLERTIKHLPTYEKYQKRQTIAVPLLNDLKIWLESKISTVPKGQLTYKALNYTLRDVHVPKCLVYGAWHHPGGAGIEGQEKRNPYPARCD